MSACECPKKGLGHEVDCLALRKGDLAYRTKDEWCSCTCHREVIADELEQLERAKARPCARCGHPFLKHQTLGGDCVQVIGRDAQGFEAYCDCARFRERL